MTIEKDIDHAYEQEEREPARSYIGASSVGSACEALLAFTLRGFPETPPSPKLKRIFKLGHILEDFVLDDLEKTKHHVLRGDESGQFSFKEVGGHVSCHLDGMIVIDGVKHVLEIKSMNDANHKKFIKDGVKFSHPKYFAQVQLMMAMSDIEKSLFIAINKNTCEYHSEVVTADAIEQMYLEEKIERILNQKPTKISRDEADWRCRSCFKEGVCWQNVPVKPECNRCNHASPTSDGGWRCHHGVAKDVCEDFILFKPEDLL
jgi:hypothetical protein